MSTSELTGSKPGFDLKIRLRQPAVADWRNLLLIGTIWLLAVLLMSPNRDFAVVDDWSYAGAVAKLLQGQPFTPPDFAEMTLVSHAYWGALFGWLFGLSFTTLTWATLCMSLLALVSFYLLLRELGFASNLAVLGTVVLGVNPLFVTYSYSYMTDITFLALLLLSSLCYVKGLPLAGRVQSDLYWLLLGSLFASLTFLTRQLGLMVTVAVVLVLLWARLRSATKPGRIPISHTGLAILVAATLPAVATAGYLLWRSNFGPTSSSSFQQIVLNDLLQNPTTALFSRGVTLLGYAPLLGLTLPLLRRPHWLYLVVWTALVGLATWLLHRQPPPSLDTAINNTSILLINRTPVWWLGVVLFAWLLASLAAGRHPKGNSRCLQLQPPTARSLLYLLTVLLLGATFLATEHFFIRYYLPLLPGLIVAGLHMVQHRSAHHLRWLWLAVLLIGLFSSLNHIDAFNYYNVRWQAGRSVLAAGVPAIQLDNGFAWNGYYLYDIAVERLGDKRLGNSAFSPDLIVDRAYVVTDTTWPGYEVVQRFPFFRWLPLPGQHEVFVMRRQ